MTNDQEFTIAHEKSPIPLESRINEAIHLIVRYGGIDGDHHKAWVLDQVCRILTRDQYAQLVAWARNGEDGPNTYEWDEGVAP